MMISFAGDVHAMTTIKIGIKSVKVFSLLIRLIYSFKAPSFRVELEGREVPIRKELSY